MSETRAERRDAIITAAGGLDPDLILLRTDEAADVLSVSTSLLSTSRRDGVMLGHPAPAHVQIGSAIRYRLSDVRAWLESALNTATPATGQS